MLLRDAVIPTRHMLPMTLQVSVAVWYNLFKAVCSCPKETHSWVAMHSGAYEVEDDEALARRLQEQEDALATRGRATRGALRVDHKKPSQAARKGASRDARHAQGLASAGVRSSSRLKPQATQGKQRPVARGSAGTPTAYALFVNT